MRERYRVCVDRPTAVDATMRWYGLSLAGIHFLLPLSCVLEGNGDLVDTVCLRHAHQPASQSEIQTLAELLSMYSCTNSSFGIYTGIPIPM